MRALGPVCVCTGRLDAEVGTSWARHGSSCARGRGRVSNALECANWHLCGL